MSCVESRPVKAGLIQGAFIGAIRDRSKAWPAKDRGVSLSRLGVRPTEWIFRFFLDFLHTIFLLAAGNLRLGFGKAS